MARLPPPPLPPLPQEPWTHENLRQAASVCRACDLHKTGTQTVFGEGTPHPEAMFVGEQPGDKEDLAGHPFVGPAGQLLNRAFVQAGIDRGRVYVTNTVKHFKWEPQGKVRLHAKPNAREILACRPWLEAEIRVIRPKVIVCLGATAAQALLGKDFRVTQRRGELIASPWAPAVIATVHPSSILRAPDPEAHERQFELFVQDLSHAAQVMRGSASSELSL